MTDSLYDICIVGGGLAGLSLAILCADANHKVVLFEKENYPFHKVCGEYISLESWNFLTKLGIDLPAFDLPVINTLELSDVKGRLYSFALPLGGFGISRYTLDFNLYTVAKSKGVEVITGSKVKDVIVDKDNSTIIAGKAEVKAKVVAACFGKRSNLDIKWKRPFTLKKKDILNNYIGIKYHVKYPHDSQQIALHNFHNGYCGLSSIEEGKSCLCYLTTAQNLKSCGNSVVEMQRQILFKNPRLKEIFTNADFLFEEPIAISQISFSKKSLVENHVFMLGDAAGMISPLCGNGMSIALHSSKLAFHAITRFLLGKISREATEREYQESWKNEFSKRIWIGRNVQRVFGGNTMTSLFLQTMHAIPPLARMLISATHGTGF